jgi:hypothetical protein
MEEERNRFPWVGRIHGTYSAALRRWPYKDPKDPHAGTDADLPMGTLVEVLERRGGWLHVRVSVGSDISLSRRLRGSKEVKGYVSQEQIELVVSGTGCMSCPFFCGYDKSKPLNTYNCAGLAFRTYVPHYLPETKEVLAKQPEVNCSIPCSQVGMIKFWLWEYDGHVEDSTQKGPTVHDFHIVGGPTVGDKSPKDSAEFYSKNNHRKVYGPSTAPSFRPPAREQATSDNELEIPEVDNNGNPVVYFMRYNFKETCYCFPCPKNLDNALW